MQDYLFLMARHGSTKLNESNRFRGWSNGPDADLDEAGIQMAHDAGEFISYLPVQIEHVIVSDLNRAQETAHIICGILGIKNFTTDKRLRPLNVGDYAGKDKSNNPIDKYLKNPTLRFPNGESVDEFNHRQYEIASEVLAKIVSGEIRLGSVLFIAHVSNVMYWENVQVGAHKEEYLDEKTDLVQPGGVAGITETNVLPLFRKTLSAEEQQDAKTDPAVVLYMPPESLQHGASCGTCFMGKPSGDCTSVHADDDKNDTTINLKTGVCGLYVKGVASDLVHINPVISRTAAGYIEKGGPTSCGLKNACQYFTHDKEYGCRKIDGRKTAKGYIEAGGCCNGWEPKT